MSEWFDINGTAMIYIRDSKLIRNSKTIKEANHKINKECKNIIKVFKNILQELTKQNPEIFDEISFEGFYPLGLDIRCFQNHAHGPAISLDNIENGEQIIIHNTATLTINGTIDTEDYEEYKQLFIDAFKQLTKEYPVFRLNLVTMWEGCQDAIIYVHNESYHETDEFYKIVTIPLVRND